MFYLTGRLRYSQVSEENVPSSTEVLQIQQNYSQVMLAYIFCLHANVKLIRQHKNYVLFFLFSQELELDISHELPHLEIIRMEFQVVVFLFFLFVFFLKIF